MGERQILLLGYFHKLYSINFWHYYQHKNTLKIIVLGYFEFLQHLETAKSLKIKVFQMSSGIVRKLFSKGEKALIKLDCMTCQQQNSSRPTVILKKRYNEDRDLQGAGVKKGTQRCDCAIKCLIHTFYIHLSFKKDWGVIVKPPS